MRSRLLKSNFALQLHSMSTIFVLFLFFRQTNSLALDDSAEDATPTALGSSTDSATTIAATGLVHHRHLPETGSWMMVDYVTKLTKRHEACFVMVDDKAYLLGGRSGNNGIPVDQYDPVTRSWCRQSSGPGVQMHHMQCVAVREKDDSTGECTGPERYVYVVSAWTGDCCMEEALPNIWVYDTLEKTWDSSIPGMDVTRQRGGAAAVLYQDEIYVSHGNQGGHGADSGGVALTMLDKFNIQTQTWTVLPDARYKRDHTGGAVVNGKICIAGGRDSGADDYRSAVVLETECFDPTTQAWSVEENIPFGRAGELYGQTCDGKLIVAGGEFGNDRKGAFDDVAVFDGTTWLVIDSMIKTRHGTGLAVDCSCNQIYAAGGATRRGSRGETRSVEHYFPDGVKRRCPGSRPLHNLLHFLRTFWRLSCPNNEL